MMRLKASDSGFRFTGWHMALCMGLFFATIIGVNIFMATMASKSWTGLIVKNTYVASQKFNGELRAAKMQKQLGWKTKLQFENGVLIVKSLEQNGKPFCFDEMSISVGRPAFEQKDQTLTLYKDAYGVYRNALTLGQGEWSFTINGAFKGKPYRRDGRILITKEGVGEVL